MAANIYHFEDHWDVPHPIEQVWNVLSRPIGYPVWWHGVYLKVEQLRGGDTADAGDRYLAQARGWLPYTLHFTIENIRIEKPRLIEFKASGDFETDASRWILETRNGGTHTVLEWNPRVEKPVVKLLSPILKPIFAWNHEWTMKRGHKQIIAYLNSAGGHV